MNKRSSLLLIGLVVAVVGSAGCADQSKSADRSEAPPEGEDAKGPGEKGKPQKQAPAASASPVSPNFRSPGTGAPQTIGEIDPTIAPTAAPTPLRHRKRAQVKAANAQAASGRLTLTQVETAIDESFDQFSKCSRGDDATVSVRALVAPSGKVIEASSTRSTPDDPAMRDCVVSAFRGLQFPAANGGAPAPLSFELVVADG